MNGAGDFRHAVNIYKWKNSMNNINNSTEKD